MQTFIYTDDTNKFSTQKRDSLPIDSNHNENEFIKEEQTFHEYSVSLDRYTIHNVVPIQKCDKSDKSKSFNGHQILVLLLLSYGNFWVAACVSLQAPFFPKEAESKGASPTQYGLVFGIYELMIAVCSPIFGKFIGKVSPVFMCEAGLFVAGFSTVLFGLLDKSPDGSTFIILCYATRMVEGIASAAFMTSSYSIMTQEFSDRVATTFSILQTFFGVGLIMGPTLGGVFYELGGFILPFALLGSLLLFGGVFAYFLLPETINSSTQKSGNLFKFISDFGTILDALAICTSLNFIGFNAATLEPHIRQFNLNPVIIGLIFVIFGVSHAIITPIWAKLCDKGFDPKKLALIGYSLCIIGFTFIGPQEFLNIDTQLWLVVVCLTLIGCGMASKLVTAFISAMHDSIHRRGFPDDMSTYGLVSAMYFSANSIGAFIGPTLGGFLLETVGYRKGTLFVLITEILFVTLLLFYIFIRKYNKSSDEEKPLLKQLNHS